MTHKKKSAPESAELRPYFKRLVEIGLKPDARSRWIPIADRLQKAEWPEDLGEPPAGWKDTEDKITFAWPLVQYIEGLYGRKGVERYSMRAFGLSDREFDDQWDSKQNSYRERWGKRLEKRLVQIERVAWATVALSAVSLVLGLLSFLVSR